LGEIRRSVVVTPGLADKKGVVRANIEFSPAEAIQNKSVATVSRNQLTVPYRAMLKYAEAEKKLNRHDTAGARKVLLEAVKIAPQYTAAWNYLGVLSYQERDLATAEQHFRHALSVEKDSYEPNVNLGGVLLAKRQVKEALVFNQKAVELRPKDALSNSQIGMNYFFLNQMDLAAEYLEKAKTADPSHSSMPQVYLSRIYERRGDREAAAREIEELLTLRPGTPQAEQWKRRLARLQASNAEPTP
jgi:Tfp pilus assembly protein PilF